MLIFNADTWVALPTMQRIADRKLSLHTAAPLRLPNCASDTDALASIFSSLSCNDTSKQPHSIEEQKCTETSWKEMQKEVDGMPSAWTLVTISFADGKLLLTRQRPLSMPIAVRLPVAGSLEHLQSSLREILQESDETLKVGGCPEGRTSLADDEKRAWWRTRRALDVRMGQLLTDAERQLLGCWKGLLLGSVPSFCQHSVKQVVSEFAQQVYTSANGLHSATQVDEMLLEACICALPWLSDDEAVHCLAQLLGWEPCSPCSAAPLPLPRQKLLQSVLVLTDGELQQN